MGGTDIAALVATRAPDHAAHTQELRDSTAPGVTVACSCGVMLTFPPAEAPRAAAPTRGRHAPKDEEE